MGRRQSVMEKGDWDGEVGVGVGVGVGGVGEEWEWEGMIGNGHVRGRASAYAVYTL